MYLANEDVGNHEELKSTKIEIHATTVIVFHYDEGVLNKYIFEIPNSIERPESNVPISLVELQKISEYLHSVHKDFSVYVWCELQVIGYIYQYNSHDQKWEKHGATKGYV